MSDDITPNPDELGKKIEELTAKLEAMQASTNDLTKERDQWRERFEETKTARDKAKTKEREEAEKRGEFEKLIGLANEELATVKAELDRHKSDLEILKGADAKLREYEESERAKLIERLPEDKREEAKGKSLDELRFAVSLLPENGSIPNVDGKKRTAHTLAEKTWADMTPEERVEFAKVNDSRAVSLKIKESLTTRR
jgi:chromosome segregation ATPase